MRRVRSTDTAPEMAVRRALHAAGLRYRLHRADLPGKPDVVLARHRTIVFVHGCFFHSHPGCGRARIPATRQDYWIPKLARNAERDCRNEEALTAAGWKVRVVWECELRLPNTLPELISVIRSDVPRTPNLNCEKGGKVSPSTGQSTTAINKVSARNG